MVGVEFKPVCPLQAPVDATQRNSHLPVVGNAATLACLPS